MIRPATQDDIPRLLELEAELFPNSMTEPVLERELRVGWGLVFDDQGVLGYALVRPFGSMLDLTRLGVDTRARGRGIAKVLLDRVIERGLPVVLAVLKDNRAALGLYKNRGFRVVGEYRAQGAWSMRRDAAASESASCPSPC